MESPSKAREQQSKPPPAAAAAEGMVGFGSDAPRPIRPPLSGSGPWPLHGHPHGIRPMERFPIGHGPGFHDSVGVGARPWSWPAQGAPQSYPRPQPQVVPPKPVSQKVIPGTSWLEVTTNTGAKYWYNKKTKESTWTKPMDAVPVQRKALDPAKAKMLERAKASGAVLAPQYAHLAIEAGDGKQIGTNTSGDKYADLYQDEDVTFTEEDILSDNPIVSSRKREASTDIYGDAKHIRTGTSNKKSISEVKTIKDVNPEITEEFNALLSESGVHAFSRYEKEIPKLKDDRRFQQVPQQMRRPLFDNYCMTCGSFKKVSKEKNADKIAENDSKKEKERIEAGFRNMLIEKINDAHLTWKEGQEILHRDIRFSSLIDPSRRESLFRSHTAKLRRMEEARILAESRAAHELSAAARRREKASAEESKNSFQALLAEVIRDPYSTWESQRRKLEEDPLGRATHPSLDDRIKQRLFDEHVEKLKERSISSGS